MYLQNQGDYDYDYSLPGQNRHNATCCYVAGVASDGGLGRDSSHSPSFVLQSSAVNRDTLHPGKTEISKIFKLCYGVNFLLKVTSLDAMVEFKICWVETFLLVVSLEPTVQ